ncbi:hypothetical protein AN958_11120 [Leucoagaricus sp. SymC.cos]|nr:hypothetical protein AN958_11120 [Leucoagaricus sp. SymC.cos]
MVDTAVKLGGIQDLAPEDTIIACVVTSSFIANFVPYDTMFPESWGQQGQAKARWNVGHSLQSHTSEVNAVRVQYSDGIRIVLVDTPGFDDTRKSDLEILKTVSYWYKDVYRRGLEISGILYLHRITDNRMAGTPQKNLRLFKKLCGDEFYDLIFLTTTMWPEDDQNDEPIFHDRQAQLEDDYWADIIKRGRKSQRFRGTQESAWEILDNVIDAAAARQQRKILQIQDELVHLAKSVPATKAGQQLHGIIEDLVKRQTDLLGRLRDELSKTSDSEAIKEILVELNSLRREREKAQKDMRRLDLSLPAWPRRLLTVLRNSQYSSCGVLRPLS